MTDQELEAITAREQRSTLGPWSVKRVQNLYPSDAGDGRTYPAVRGFRCPKAIYERAWEQVAQDAQFMAGAGGGGGRPRGAGGAPPGGPGPPKRRPGACGVVSASCTRRCRRTSTSS